MSWRDCVTQTSGVERLNNLNSYIRRLDLSSKSPIDQFYEETRKIISFATPDKINDFEHLGPFCVVGIVSCCENYFRQVFSSILSICNESQKTAATHTINIGSVIWHPNGEMAKGAFEHTSLASSDNIFKTCEKYLGIKLKSHGLEAIYKEFDKICEFRHGIVHSNRVLAGKNGIKLQLDSSPKLTVIEIKFAVLQEILAICQAMIVSTNTVLFEVMCIRWAKAWRNCPSWKPECENDRFKSIWHLFLSRTDIENGSIEAELTWIKCKNEIKREFDL